MRRFEWRWHLGDLIVSMFSSDGKLLGSYKFDGMKDARGTRSWATVRGRDYIHGRSHQMVAILRASWGEMLAKEFAEASDA